jgi:AcrR family transcriptional regulator
VLSAAFALFCEHGYAGTSTKRIAQAAGVAEGLLFHYFPTKEALLLEVASRQHTFAGRVLSLVTNVGEKGTARELFAAVAQGLEGVSPSESAFIAFMLAEAQVNAPLRAKLVAGTQVVLGGFVQMLKARVASGELSAEASLDAAAHGFFGGFLFFFSQHRHLGPAAWRREASQFAKAWAEQCWRGIASPALLSIDSKNAASKTARPKGPKEQP